MRLDDQAATVRIDQRMTLATVDFLAGIVAARSSVEPYSNLCILVTVANILYDSSALQGDTLALPLKATLGQITVTQ